MAEPSSAQERPTARVTTRMPINLQEALETYFENTPCQGDGDLRAEITLEMLQRTEANDHWIVCGRRLSRGQIMELMLDLVAGGTYSVPKILQIAGMPKPRTYLSWIREYKPFAEMMEVAEQMQARFHIDDAIEIADGERDPETGRSMDVDGRQGFRDKVRADLRMRMAEIFDPRKYGKKQMVDVTHHQDLPPEEQWSRFNSILRSHSQMIEAKLGVKITFKDQDQATIDVTPEPDAPVIDVKTLGMEGENPPEDDFNADLRF